MNSDPVLDLGEVARRSDPRLRCCLSTPIVAGDTLVGVLTLYSAGQDSFTDDSRRILEAVARHIARVLPIGGQNGGATFGSAARTTGSSRR
jgi:GAF domain-containing protein